MLINVRPAYLIQDVSTGLFLSEELHWVRSFKRAGRCRDAVEALETAKVNTDDEFEIHTIYEIER